MKFLCLAYYDVDATQAMPKDELNAITSQCPPRDAALRASGHLVVQASLSAPTATRVIKPRRGRKTVLDGPFTEAKELVGGFFIIEARDMDQAVEIASLHPAAELGEPIGWGIEIWPIGRLDLIAAPEADPAP
jgi:hypothetical protein